MAASSSSNRHEVLQFHMEMDETKFRTLVNKNILATYHLHHSRMHTMKHWLEFIVPIQWRRVFAIDCIPYRELVLEFFSTFSILTGNLDNNYPTIIFKLGNVMRAVSLREFALRLGIYTHEDIDQGLLGLWHSATPSQLLEFRKQLVDYRNFKVMYIQDSRHRILYQLISAAVFGHREITGDLNHTDIHIMYSILQSQYLCPALYIARACMDKFPGEGNISPICGGKFVTKLAASYGLLTTDFTRTLKPVGRVYILDIRTNRRLNEIDDSNHTSWVLLHDASPDDTPTQEIYSEAIHVETTGSTLVQPLPVTVLESWAAHPGASSSRQFASTSPQGVSSSVPGFSSFQELLQLPEIPPSQNFLEFPEIPSFQTLLDLPEFPLSQGLLDFPELPMSELPPQLSLEEIVQQIGLHQTIHPGESFPQQGVPSYQQNIPPSTPVVQAQPTLDDLYKEIMEVKKNLSDLTAWLMNRLS